MTQAWWTCHEPVAKNSLQCTIIMSIDHSACILSILVSTLPVIVFCRHAVVETHNRNASRDYTYISCWPLYSDSNRSQYILSTLVSTLPVIVLCRHAVVRSYIPKPTLEMHDLQLLHEYLWAEKISLFSARNPSSSWLQRRLRTHHIMTSSHYYSVVFQLFPAGKWEMNSYPVPDRLDR